MLLTDKQTDKQIHQRYRKHNLLCQGGSDMLLTAQYPTGILQSQIALIILIFQCRQLKDHDKFNLE